MNKTMVIISAFALIMMYGIAPVMASPTFSPVTGTQIGGFKPGTLTYHLNEGGIFFFDAEVVGSVNLDIDSETIPDYALTVYGIVNASINTKTDDGLLHYKFVWSYSDAGQVIGTFEGEALARTTTYVYMPATGNPHPYYSTNLIHAVLQGTGVFKGQTLMLDGIRPTLDPTVYPPKTGPNPISWEGTLMIR